MLGTDLIFIVECKFYNKKVSVEDILTFKSRIDDIRAHKGIFVTTNGYQKGAYTFAKENGIALVTVEGLKWRLISAYPTLDYVVAGSYLSDLINDFRAYHGEINSGLKTGIENIMQDIRFDHEVFVFPTILFFSKEAIIEYLSTPETYLLE